MIKLLLKIMEMSPESLQNRLSFNIKMNRKRVSLSQERLAEEAGISVQMMSDIEGCRRWPSEKTLAKISTALGVDAHALFLPEDYKPEASAQVRASIAIDLQKIFSESVEKYLNGFSAQT